MSDLGGTLAFDLGGTVAGVGPLGAATLALALEPGTKVTYAWGTDIFKSYSGAEQRSNTTGPMPRQRFDGNAFLLDGSDRDIRGALQRAAPAGSTFFLALPYEELVLTADSVGAVVTVVGTARCDWVLPGQRCVLVSGDGNTIQGAVIQSSTTTTITLRATDSMGNLIAITTLGAAGKAGARIMPLVQVLLENSQGFARYSVNAGMWSIRAMANVFGWAGVDSMGAGAQIVTYGAGVAVPVSSLLDSDLLVWDRVNGVDNTAAEAMLSGAELVDMGALPFGIGGQVVPDWARPIKYSSADPADWQWLKAFLRAVLGRQRAFALSTNRPDLVPISTAGLTMLVESASVAGGGDYATWFNSSAGHRRLVLTGSDGQAQYVTVSGVVDNGNGTLTLTFADAIVTDTVAKVSFLEQVRLDMGDSDEIPVTWDGGTFSVELLARTTEEAIAPASAFMYDTILGATFTIGTSAELVIAAGRATYVKYTTGLGTRVIGAIRVTSPGGAQGGMIVTISHEATPGSSNMSLGHEDTTWPSTERLWLAGMTTPRTGDNGSFTFIYSAAMQRWIQIWGGF